MEKEPQLWRLCSDEVAWFGSGVDFCDPGGSHLSVSFPSVREPGRKDINNQGQVQLHLFGFVTWLDLTGWTPSMQPLATQCSSQWYPVIYTQWDCNIQYICTIYSKCCLLVEKKVLTPNGTNSLEACTYCEFNVFLLQTCHCYIWLMCYSVTSKSLLYFKGNRPPKYLLGKHRASSSAWKTVLTNRKMFFCP